MKRLDDLLAETEAERVDLGRYYRDVAEEVSTRDANARWHITGLEQLRLRFTRTREARARQWLEEDIRETEQGLVLQPARLIEAITLMDIYLALIQQGRKHTHKTLPEIGNIWRHRQVREITALDSAEETARTLTGIMDGLIRGAIHAVLFRHAAVAGTAYTDPGTAPKGNRLLQDMLRDKYAARPDGY